MDNPIEQTRGDEGVQQAEVANELYIENPDEIPDDGKPPIFEFLTGMAGTGKTFEIQRRIREDPRYAVLAASTGIAAVNLGAVTINSLLKYYDLESLRDNFTSGFLQVVLNKLCMDYRRIVIDEVSMLGGDSLDLIFEANQNIRRPLGIVLTGDFCQLCPIKSKWAFQAECWPYFEKNIQRLTKVWRQTDPQFLEALSMIRYGKGFDGVKLLQEHGQVKFENHNDTHFDGTTVMSKNDQVNNFNKLALDQLPGKDIAVRSLRWGKQDSGWKQVPEVLRMKIGAYVMILSNCPPDFPWANGDCGHVVDYQAGRFHIQLVRNQQIVQIAPIVRRTVQKERPEGSDNCYLPDPKEPFTQRRPYLALITERKKRWIMGEVMYYPLRIAYAATIHKTQGLSLDRVQIDVRNPFFSKPAMAYVALSRGRTPEGIRIVGGADTLARRVNVAPEVVKWL